MPEPIQIDIPEEIDFHDPDWVQEVIADDIDALLPALDLRGRGDRGVADNIEIIRADIRQGVVTIEYSYEYSIYHGCDDYNYHELHKETISGVIEADKILFNVFIPPEKPSTADEF